MLSTVFFIFCGCIAAKLSYDCNTLFKMSSFWKIWYAFWSFLGNFGYLINYFIFKRGHCTMNNVMRAHR